MPDEGSPLPWTNQQWSELRAVALDSARSSRVASTFLPLIGPLPADQSTVPSNWMTLDPLAAPRQRGEAANRLEVRSGKTLHLVTISCNVYLRGAEVADPELNAAKAMVRRAAEILGRLEDAIVFHGREDKDDDIPRLAGTTTAVVQPEVYTISGGRDLTGLLQAPDTYFVARARRDGAESGSRRLKVALDDLANKRRELVEAQRKFEEADEVFAHVRPRRLSRTTRTPWRRRASNRRGGRQRNREAGKKGALRPVRGRPGPQAVP
jgi:hypothetical protein